MKKSGACWHMLMSLVLFHIQLYDKQVFEDKGAHWISLLKTKKKLLNVIPAGLTG